MYKVFNMGHRMEVYCEAEMAGTVIEVSNGFNIDARIIGRTGRSAAGNRLSLTHDDEVFVYKP